MECSFHAYKRIRKPRIVFDLSNDNEIQILRMNEGKYYSVVYGAESSLDRVAIQYPACAFIPEIASIARWKTRWKNSHDPIGKFNFQRQKSPKPSASKAYSIAKTRSEINQFPRSRCLSKDRCVSSFDFAHKYLFIARRANLDRSTNQTPVCKTCWKQFWTIIFLEFSNTIKIFLTEKL